MNNVLQMLLDAATQHIPSGADWAPVAMGAAVLLGLVLLGRGARLAPWLAALAFMVIGGVGGSFLGNGLGLPLWPTIGVTGVVAFFAGLLLFRLWLATLLAGCLILASLGVFYVNELNPHVARFTTENFDTQHQLVQLPQPGAAESTARSATAELGRLWTYLSANVPNFQRNFFGIVLIAGVVGLLLGLLIPSVGKSLWAASSGTILLAAGVFGLLDMYYPPGRDWLLSLGTWGWGVLGVVWTASVFHNLFSCRRKKVVTVVEEKPAKMTAMEATA